MEKLSLTEFTAEVNRLAQVKCDKLNARQLKRPKAFIVSYPESMMKSYWQFDFAPAEALKELIRAGY